MVLAGNSTEYTCGIKYTTPAIGIIHLPKDTNALAPFVEAILILSARFRTIFSKTAMI